MTRNLRGIDLNLVPVLRALLETHSVGRAADMLGLSQPATSQALGRLRTIFGDQLLVRSARGMKLTYRAQRLRERVMTSCDALEALLASEHFDPAVARRRFTIGATDFAALLIARSLLPVLRERAPGIEVVFSEASGDVARKIVDGALSLAVIVRGPASFAGLSVDAGYNDSRICLASPDHPLATRSRISLDELSRYRRLSIDFGAEVLLDHGDPDLVEPIRVATSQLLVLPLLTAHSGGIAIVTRALGTLAAGLAPVRLIELEESGDPIDVCMIWDPANEGDAAHQWLRLQIAPILRGCFPKRP